MRQIWISKAGAPSVLEVRETATQEPGPGEIRVAVRAAGINFADIMARMGIYPDAPPLPCVVGYEVAGVVEAVGADVKDCEVGQRVFAATQFGGYTSDLIVPASQVVAIPEGVSFEAAAAIPVNYLTAWYMLIHLGNVQPGDRVLVHAVAGGVGQAALQICKWRGAEVFGTASASKHARLREYGVAHCIDYRNQDFEQEIKRLTNGEGVDIVLDAVGGNSFKKSYRSLNDLGRLLMFGASSFATGKKRSIVAAVKGMMAMPRFGAIGLMNDNKGVIGFNLGHLWGRVDLSVKYLQEIVALVADGTLTPRVDRSFPFEQAGDAHSYIQDRKNFGKVLLTP